MDISFDLFDREPDSARAAARPGNASPDWHDLRTRLLAGHAARRALRDLACALHAPDSGSFDCSSARLISGYGHAYPGVNLVRSGNGKPDSHIVAAFAGEASSGDRG